MASSKVPLGSEEKLGEGIIRGAWEGDEFPIQLVSKGVMAIGKETNSGVPRGRIMTTKEIKATSWKIKITSKWKKLVMGNFLFNLRSVPDNLPKCNHRKVDAKIKDVTRHEKPPAITRAARNNARFALSKDWGIRE